MRHRLQICTAAVLLLLAGCATAFGAAPHWPLPETRSALVRFGTAPFPYHGTMPDGGTPFFDTTDGERAGHTSVRAGIYWEDQTYADNRTLIAFPKGFDPRRPAAIIVYFHGNNATLARDVVDRQRIIEQIEASGINGILVAPQFAVDALDSSAGRFWQPGAFAQYMSEAAADIAAMLGVKKSAAAFNKLPIILVAYSGGYNPAAFSLELGGVGKRIKGVLLLDSAYGEAEKFANWIERSRRSAFFFSAYLDGGESGNNEIASLLAQDGIRVSSRPPDQLVPGSITFFPVAGVSDHNNFVTSAWVPDPLAWLLARIPGYHR
jgi:hypothetical protein